MSSASADVLKHLKGLKASWDTMKQDPDIDKGGFTRHPDGKYVADLTGFDIGASQGSGRMQITWEWTFMEGELAGEIQRDYDGLMKPDSLKFVLQKLKLLGVGIRELDIEELPALGEALVQARPQVLLQLRTGKPNQQGERYQNIYINRLIGMNGEKIDDATAPDPTDEVEQARTSAAPETATVPQPAKSDDGAIGIGDKVAWVEGSEDKIGLVRGFVDDAKTILSVLSGGKTYSIAVAEATLISKSED